MLGGCRKGGGGDPEEGMLVMVSVVEVMATETSDMMET